MSQLQEINILFQKRIAQLERKKERCMDYSATPNSCVRKVEAQIARTRKLSRLSKFRTRSLESRSYVDSYLDHLQEGGPKSPVAKAVTYGLGGVAMYKGAKWGVKRSDCKQYKYSPYLHKQCMKGLDESIEMLDEQTPEEQARVMNKARRLGPVFGAVYLRKKRKQMQQQQVAEAEGWHGLPKGWKQSSLKKFSKSLTGKDATKKGFFDKCVKRMQGKIDNPEAFCAATKDEAHGSTFWRGKGKSPQQTGKDVKRIRNVQRG